MAQEISQLDPINNSSSTTTRQFVSSNLSQQFSLEESRQNLLESQIVNPVGGSRLEERKKKSQLCSLYEILTESTKTAQYSFLNTYLMPRSKRFIQIKQQSICFNNEMSRLVIVKDVTKILLSKNLKQQNSKIVLNQASLARSMLEPIKHIKRGIENKLQTAAANVTDWSMF